MVSLCYLASSIHDQALFCSIAFCPSYHPHLCDCIDPCHSHVPFDKDFVIHFKHDAYRPSYLSFCCIVWGFRSCSRTDESPSAPTVSLEHAHKKLFVCGTLSISTSLLCLPEALEVFNEVSGYFTLKVCMMDQSKLIFPFTNCAHFHVFAVFQRSPCNLALLSLGFSLWLVLALLIDFSNIIIF